MFYTKLYHHVHIHICTIIYIYREIDREKDYGYHVSSLGCLYGCPDLKASELLRAQIINAWTGAWESREVNNLYALPRALASFTGGVITCTILLL